MSLTSYRAAPPRGGVCCGPRVRARSVVRPAPLRGWPGLSVTLRVSCRGGTRVAAGVGRVWKAWRRPTLPRLEAQYHRRRGFSRPSSGWDRVLCPSLWPPGRPKPRETRELGERLVERGPGLDPGPSSPSGRPKRVAGVFLKARLAALFDGPRTLVRGIVRPTARGASRVSGFRRSGASPVAAAEQGFRR
jgi:hypothetical protein